MISDNAYVLFEGYLREVVGQFNENLIIDNGVQYIIIPDKVYPKFDLSDLSLTE
jgi:hypothetical protein